MSLALRGVHDRRVVLAISLTMVSVILVLDALAPAGIVVGILLAIPIFLVSGSSSPRDVWVVFLLTVAGKIVAALFGAGPISPAAVWIPNRIFAFLTLPAAFAIALELQKRRLLAERSRDLNHLLTALLAHDLRSPLITADQALEYLSDAEAGDRPIDRGLVADVRASLRRSLGAVDALLEVARHEVAGAVHPAAEDLPPCTPGSEIEAEVAGFRAEAGVREKELLVDVGRAGGVVRMDRLVLRQSLSILVDNAIKHSGPGAVRITAVLGGARLTVEVEDPGARADPHTMVANRRFAGAGLGLDLCRALVKKAGGELCLAVSETGTICRLELPTSPDQRSNGR